jgi:hypothetical protein
MNRCFGDALDKPHNQYRKKEKRYVIGDSLNLEARVSQLIAKLGCGVPATMV